MRAYGLTYDTGFATVGTTTHEPFRPEVVRREMEIIREHLLCDAVRVTGGMQYRLEDAAQAAAAVGPGRTTSNIRTGAAICDRPRPELIQSRELGRCGGALASAAC